MKKQPFLCGRFKTYNFVGEEQHIIHIEGQVKDLSSIILQ